MNQPASKALLFLIQKTVLSKQLPSVWQGFNHPARRRTAAARPIAKCDSLSPSDGKRYAPNGFSMATRLSGTRSGHYFVSNIKGCCAWLSACSSWTTASATGV